MVRGYTNGGWGQVHHRRCGERGPWVVLLHESPRTSAVYDRVLPLLGAQVRAVALDTPGYGGSDGPPDEHRSPAEFAARLLEAVRALGVGEFVPVGLKTGSDLGTELALQAGCTRAVLSAPEVFDAVRAEHRAATWAPPIVPKADGSHLRALWDKNVGLYGTDSPRDLTEAVGDVLTNLDGYATAYPASLRHDSRAALGRLVATGCDVLLFRPTGARLTVTEPLEFAEVPGARVVTFPVPGHLATRLPERFAAHVLEHVVAGRRGPG